MKHCSQCKKPKPLNAYSRDAKTKDGRRAMCKSCCSERRNIGKSLLARFNKYGRDAARRGYAFTLTQKQFDLISSRPCEYCGDFNGEGFDERPYNGIDRRDNAQGYTKANSVSCCSECNYFKGKMDEVDFLEHVKQIAEFQARKAKKERE